MLIFRHWENLPEEARGAAVAIGNFDGIHRGHQAVIGKAGKVARSDRRPHGVLTFEPHPRRFFQPDAPPFQLTPFRTKARLIEALGVDVLFVLPFDPEMAARPPEDFVREILIDGLAAGHVVVGDDFAFGKGRAGNTGLLAEMVGRADIGFSAVPPVTDADGKPYSSSRIRACLRAGEPDRAAKLLGRFWEVEGRVQEGDRRGRQLGFPTANVPLVEVLEPARGAYAVRAGVDRGAETVWHDGVANFGVRPTMDGKNLLLEAHLFEFAEDIYGEHLRVALVEHLRPEMAFDGLDALSAQIQADTARAREILVMDRWKAGWPGTPPHL